MQREIEITDELLEFSDLRGLDIYLPRSVDTNQNNNILLPSFPYLQEEAIRSLKLTEFYELLNRTTATSEEVELLRIQRRRLQKSHFKQKYDKRGRRAFQDLEQRLADLNEEKEELVKMKRQLQAELKFYKDSLQQV